MRVMDKIRARVPWEFFRELYLFSAELLDGDAMVVKACGVKPSNGDRRDGGILRSREYLLFGHGLATLVPRSHCDGNRDGYVMEVTRKCDTRGVTYWEFQSAGDQLMDSLPWRLNVSNSPPDPDMEGHVQRLIEISGDPGQYIYLACTA